MSILRFFLILFLLSLQNGFAQKIHFKKSEGGFWIFENSDSVMFFQRELKDKEGQLARNNYFHPVFDLNGNVLTEDFPEDHPHHRGIFWSWHQLLVNEEQVCDAWILENFKQNIFDVQFNAINLGKGVFAYQSNWFAIDNPDQPLVNEKTKVVVYAATKKYRRVDFSISLQAMVENFKLGGSNDEKGYGGFSVRMKTDGNTVFSSLKNEAIVPQNLSIKLGNYVNIVNPEHKSGVVLIDQTNIKEETEWILRQDDSMQNIKFPGRNPIPLSSQTPLVLNYTILIHNGTLTVSEIKKAINQP